MVVVERGRPSQPPPAFHSSAQLSLCWTTSVCAICRSSLPHLELQLPRALVWLWRHCPPLPSEFPRQALSSARFLSPTPRRLFTFSHPVQRRLCAVRLFKSRLTAACSFVLSRAAQQHPTATHLASLRSLDKG